MNGNATNSKKRLAPEAARKAFKREYDDVWMAIAGQADKIGLARAIQDRADKVRDKLYDHYGKHKDRWVKYEMARLTDASFRPRPELRPRWAGLTWQGFKREATINVANRQSARFRRVNAMERAMLETQVLGKKPRQRPVNARSVNMSERDAMVLDAVDRAKSLRDRTRQHFADTKSERLGRAVMRGATDPLHEIFREEALRVQRINRAERNLVGRALDLNPAQSSNPARRKSGPTHSR
ncbi:MAG: hypothetical protein ACJA0K_000665 [Maricaulis maris]|jgi:hypothetical protein